MCCVSPSIVTCVLPLWATVIMAKVKYVVKLKYSHHKSLTMKPPAAGKTRSSLPTRQRLLNATRAGIEARVSHTVAKSSAVTLCINVFQCFKGNFKCVTCKETNYNGLPSLTLLFFTAPFCCFGEGPRKAGNKSKVRACALGCGMSRRKHFFFFLV